MMNSKPTSINLPPILVLSILHRTLVKTLACPFSNRSYSQKFCSIVFPSHLYTKLLSFFHNLGFVSHNFFKLANRSINIFFQDNVSSRCSSHIHSLLPLLTFFNSVDYPSEIVYDRLIDITSPQMSLKKVQKLSFDRQSLWGFENPTIGNH
ncbi:hypothetical protein GEMRC1_012757 [Eukaryota sp. GEM-RC1]